MRAPITNITPIRPASARREEAALDGFDVEVLVLVEVDLLLLVDEPRFTVVVGAEPVNELNPEVAELPDVMSKSSDCA